MPPLSNPRHERFCQALFEGKPANKAYEEAGYQPHDGNCIRLRGNERIKARLAELQEAVAKDNAVTVSSLLSELEAARAKATDLDQLSAAVRAIEAKAKVSGLLIQRTEIGGPGDFSQCKTTAEVIEAMAKDLMAESPDAVFTAKDKAALREMFEEIHRYINGCKAKPVNNSAYGYDPDGERKDVFAYGRKLRRQLEQR